MVCKGKGFYCVKGMKLRAFLLTHFLVRYKPVIPDAGSQDETGLCLTGTSAYGGVGFALKVPFPVQIRAVV